MCWFTIDFCSLALGRRTNGIVGNDGGKKHKEMRLQNKTTKRLSDEIQLKEKEEVREPSENLDSETSTKTTTSET